MLDDNFTIGREEPDALFDSFENVEPLPEMTASDAVEALVRGVLQDPQFSHCNRETLEEGARILARALAGDREAIEKAQLIALGVNLFGTELAEVSQSVAKRLR